ncbi:MAG: hypothetical protein JOZ62_13695 [Acidobacteriaceae bacterium]|nr:hypothetical protein [Acidobacteriaceae bacterium]
MPDFLSILCVAKRRQRESNGRMLSKTVLAILAIGLASSCSGPRANPGDTNQQVGNPNAHPESEITAKSNRQDSGDKAGKSSHTDRTDTERRQ